MKSTIRSQKQDRATHWGGAGAPACDLRAARSVVRGAADVPLTAKNAAARAAERRATVKTMAGRTEGKKSDPGKLEDSKLKS